MAGFCVGIGGINSIYEQVITNDGGESPASQRRKYSAQDRRRIYEPAACGAQCVTRAHSYQRHHF
ncbi:MAG: hypothetical protein VZR95_03475 [Alphaproteobacteria bacterium]